MDAATRQLVRRRASDRCEHCRLPQSAAPFFRFHVEHVLATQHLADDSLENLALACPDCNRHKGPNLTSIDLETMTVVPVFHPRHDDWSQHFKIEGAKVVGKSAIGRPTVRLLQFNEVERTLMRRVLFDIGEWPPSVIQVAE